MAESLPPTLLCRPAVTVRALSSCRKFSASISTCAGSAIGMLRTDSSRSVLICSGEKSLNEAKNLSSPLMLHIARKDQFCPPEAQQQIHETLDRNPLVTIHDYPEQDHAFGRTGGEHYDANAAELANLRTLEFFVRNLAGEGFAGAQKSLSERWDEHVKYEFATHNTEDTLKTMVADANVNQVPVLTGVVGCEQLRVV